MSDVQRKVTIIPAKPKLEQQIAMRKKNVAAYCRVSTEEEEQQSSYEAQCSYYTDLIMKNPEWNMAGIFADEGITGTSTKKREDFNRMIRKCRAGKIDLILTKSISRFARNTLDSLKYIRALKGIDGYIAMDMGDIATLNDALGGVTVTLEEDLSQEDPSMIPGTTMTLTGHQAEVFVRYRATVADGTNTNRMKRQRTYMTAVLEMLEAEDGPWAQELLEAMGGEIGTDLTQQELLADFDRWRKYRRETIQTMEGRHSVDEDGFVAFYPEEQWLETYLLRYFYE